MVRSLIGLKVIWRNLLILIFKKDMTCSSLLVLYEYVCPLPCQNWDDHLPCSNYIWKPKQHGGQSFCAEYDLMLSSLVVAAVYYLASSSCRIPHYRINLLFVNVHFFLLLLLLIIIWFYQVVKVTPCGPSSLSSLHKPALVCHIAASWDVSNYT